MAQLDEDSGSAGTQLGKCLDDAKVPRQGQCSIGVVIPTRDRQNDLVSSIRAWLDQDLAVDEILIVESGNLEKTQHVLEQAGILPKVKLIACLPGLPRQRNFGFCRASAEILFLTDDDLWPEPAFARTLAAHFAHDSEQRLGAVGGLIHDHTRLPGPLGQLVRSVFGLSRIGAEGRMQRSGFGIFPLARTEGVIPVEVLPGTCLAVRKSVFPEFSFDEKLEGYALMEDADFTFRLGQRFKMLYDPSVTAVHHAVPAGRHTLLDYCAMMVVNYHYLFQKNRELGRFSKPAYYRAMFGLWIYWGILRGIQARTLNTLRGLIKGTRMMMRGEMWPASMTPSSPPAPGGVRRDASPEANQPDREEDGR